MRVKQEFISVFDFGGFLDIDQARRALEGAYAIRDVPSIKGAPDYVTFAPALLLDLPDGGRLARPDGTPCRLHAKIFEVGAMAIHHEARYETRSVEDLPAEWELPLARDGRPVRKEDAARAFFEEIRAKVVSFLIDRYDVDVKPERFMTFSVECPRWEMPGWVERNRAPLAGLLTGERDWARLSAPEIAQILGTRFTYFRDEVCFLAPEGAVTVAESLEGTDDALTVVELACVQRLELRAYDAYLDRVIPKAVGDVRVIFSRWGFLTGRARRMVEELAEVRAEIEQMADEIDNTAKFYGDWYFGRLYAGCRRKLRIDHWTESIREKLATVGELYRLAADEVTSRRFILLELLIVALFVLEIGLILVIG